MFTGKLVSLLAIKEGQNIEQKSNNVLRTHATYSQNNNVYISEHSTLYKQVANNSLYK
jgi:hypothetical protein